MHDFLLNILIPLLMCPVFLGSFLWMSCCCTPSCTFFTDDFNRSDDDDPGAYTEVSGDWDISSNKLVTSDSSAVLIADAEHPDGEPNIKVSVTVNIATSGDTARIILDYVDSSNYWFAELKAGTGAYLKIYRRSGGTNTEMASESFAIGTGDILFCASIANDNVLIASANGRAIQYGASFSSSSWGLGTGAIGGTVSFDDLVVSKTSENCPSCGGDTVTCQANCQGNTSPQQFEITINSIVDDTGCTECSSLNGTFIVDFVGLIGGPGSACLYQYAGPASCSGHYVPVNLLIGSSTIYPPYNLVVTRPGLGGDANDIKWGKTVSLPINCLNLDETIGNEITENFGPPFGCKGSGGTVRVRAIT